MKLSYEPISAVSQLSNLDFTDNNCTDPLKIHYFALNKAFYYHQNRLCTVRVIRDESHDVVGYFAVSMSALSVEDLDATEKVAGATPIRYPALLLGQLGVDKKYRSQGIGAAICKFCVGLAQVIGESVACRYVGLQTSEDRTKLYEHIGFAKSPLVKNKKVWMYKRVI